METVQFGELVELNLSLGSSFAAAVCTPAAVFTRNSTRFQIPSNLTAVASCSVRNLKLLLASGFPMKHKGCHRIVAISLQMQ